MEKKAIVVIPAYNEGETIKQTLENVWSIKKEVKKQYIELLIFVVDDGSIDGTGTIAKEFASQVITHNVNKGLGAAVRNGLKAARKAGASYAIKFDADCQHNPKDILSLLQPLIKDEVDVVYGNRFKNISYKVPFVRRVGNKVFTGLTRWLTGWPVEDSQPGIFAVNKRYLEVLYLPGNYNYTQQVLFNAYNEGLRFAQKPVSFNKRERGASFVSYKYPFKVLPQIVQVLIGIKPLKVFGTLGLFACFLALVVSLINLTQWITGVTDKPIEHSNFVIGVGLFGLQTLFFGLLADMIVQLQRHKK